MKPKTGYEKILVNVCLFSEGSSGFENNTFWHLVLTWGSMSFGKAKISLSKKLYRYFWIGRANAVLKALG